MFFTLIKKKKKENDNQVEKHFNILIEIKVYTDRFVVDKNRRFTDHTSQDACSVDVSAHDCYIAMIFSTLHYISRGKFVHLFF